MPFQRKSRPKDAPPLTPDEALAKLEHFCAFRERCPQEVKQKIQELRLDKALGQQLYQLLETEGFFNEKRFAEVFVRSKFRSNHWGRIRIRLELKMRDIDPELIETALAEQLEEEDYLDYLQTALSKKISQLKDDPQARNKAAATLIRAGFEPDLVFKILSK
jgi:regulatory protein